MEWIGPYKVEREVARGGMGVVYRALDPKLQRPVAIKVLSTAAPNQRDLARFEREGQALAALRHPNVMGVLASGQVGGHPYLAVDWIEGESLQERLEREGPLPIDEVLEIGESLATTLAHCHGAGVLHRDLKPHNVMAGLDGRLVVADFGLAALRGSDERLTLSSEAMGTPGYMAPEQTGGEEVGPPADVYGIGATLYALLTGQPPFTGSVMQVLSSVLNKTPPSPRSLRPDVPAPFAAVLMRCLGKGPADRFESAAELADALTAVRGAPSDAGGAGLRLAGGLIVVLTLVLVGALALRGGESPPAPSPTTALPLPDAPPDVVPPDAVTPSPSPTPTASPSAAAPGLRVKATLVGSARSSRGGFVTAVLLDGPERLFAVLNGPLTIKWRRGRQPVELEQISRPGVPKGQQLGSAFDPARRLLYMTNYGEARAYLIHVPVGGPAKPVMQSKTPQPKFLQHPAPILKAVHALPDGRVLLAGGQQLSLWSAAGNLLKVAPTGDEYSVFQVVVDGSKLFVSTHAVGTKVGRVHIFDLNTLSRLRTLPHQTASFCIAPSPNGEFLLTGDSQGWLHLWRLADMEELWKVRTGSALHPRWGHCMVHPVAWSADGTLAFAGDPRGRVHVVRARTGKRISTWLAQQPVVIKGARRPDWVTTIVSDPPYLLTGGNYGTVNQYRLELESD